MNTLNKKVETIARLVNELRRHLASDPKAVEHTLNGVWELIRRVDAHPEPEPSPRAIRLRWNGSEKPPPHRSHCRCLGT